MREVDGPAEPPILLFDGVCTLCNEAVDFVMRHERTTELRFASLQSELGQSLLREAGLDDPALDSLVLVERRGASTHSGAALRLCRYLRWPWRAGAVLLLVPRFLRDPVYRWVARNRYRWFGKRETCRLPGPEERARLLG